MTNSSALTLFRKKKHANIPDNKVGVKLYNLLF